MRNLSILTPFFVFFLLFHTSITISAPRYIAVDDITLNCGTSGTSTDVDNRVWVGDMNPKSAPIEAANHKSAPSVALGEGYSDAVPYQTARISFSQFKYEFRVTPGPKFLRLYFYNASYQGFEDSTDLFTVKAGSFTLLNNFSASLADSFVGGSISEEFCVNVGEEKTLDVSFIPSPSDSRRFYAFVNGIEIVSMPNDLYYRQDIPYVGQDFQFSIDTHFALEKFVRLNMGGGKILPVEDTGMFREWSPDISYNFGGGVIPSDSSLKPIYSKIPNYIAPDDVYRTAVSMGPNRTKNLHSNLTWRVPVDSGFDYLVRLHFCEIQPEITSAGERPFLIYIDNQIADDSADVLLWSERSETPVYKDFLVKIQNKTDLSVALHPRGARFLIDDAILNGMEVFKLSDLNDNLAIAGPWPAQKPASAINESKTNTRIILIGSGVAILVMVTFACVIVLRKLKRTKRSTSYYPPSKCWCWPEPNKGKSTKTRAASLPGELCHYFTLREIKRATENFKEELIIGVGGFGKVYKGLVNEGKTTVAIKRLNPESTQGFREFRTEIEVLSQLRHVHLVSLIGYCNEEGETILVYDFMANGTLRRHLYETHNDPLSWKQRLQICVGAARGLDYLHTGVKRPIIHRDVKTTNILLDDNWVAKVSDFGLSKMGQENSGIRTGVKSMWGYLDPEYARCGQLTVKSDVYSFGVVLLEVLCSRKAVNKKLETPQWDLANWARECIVKGTISEIIDPNLKGKIAPQCFKVYVETAESCVREQVIQRPTMTDVKEKLEFALELQECVDAEMEKINAGGHHTYPEGLSFPVPGTSDVPRINNVYSEHGLKTDSGTALGTTNVGLTSSSLDSDAIVGEDAFRKSHKL